jgi:glycosyltransferase involved in cell wall biosynthesis
LGPTVSVIIPCYNSERTLSDTLESLQKQTFRDWEAIVVNDGSTDNSLRITERFQAKDSRIKRVDQDNQGLASARNAGLSIASGEFVNFLDADDLLLPDMLHSTVRKLRDDPFLAAAYCGWIYSDAQMRDLSWVITPRLEGQLFEKLAHGNLFPCHSVLLRRKSLEHVGLFDCSLRHCHDWDLWIRVARAGGRFGCVSEALVIYRMLPASLSRNPSSFFEAGKEVIRRSHNPDDRVRDPVGEFKQGCQCSMTELMLEWGIRCAGFAIAQGDATQASRLFETVLERGNGQITPKMIATVGRTIWFAAAVPKGDWETLWERIGRPLLRFLLQVEERLDIPGFAMQSLLEITGWQKPMSGREHLLALRQKIVRRVFRREKTHVPI